MQRAIKTTIIKSDSKKLVRILESVLSAAAFCTLYLMLISTVPFNAAYYAVLPIGVAAVVVLLVFHNNKYVIIGVPSVVLLFTILGVAAGFFEFKNGMLAFFNAAIRQMNEVKHAGYESYAVNASFGADFLFSAVAVAWIAVLSVFSTKKPYVFICGASLILFVLLCLGLYPSYYSVVMIVLIFMGLLAKHNGFTIKAGLCYILCALAVSVATIPCYYFSGSRAVEDFGQTVTEAFENSIYGNSLPNGRLDKSYGMSSSNKVRLKLTLPQLTPTLYLKGFIGSELDGSTWNSTDKNTYVQNGYQGLMDYLAQGGLPTTQYAQYAKLCSNTNKYELKIENVSADRRYIYSPYTLSEYDVGTAYYDMGLRGGVFTSKTYTQTIFAPDESGERVTQAQWITDEFNRTTAMEEYIGLEGQYRAFVYDVYTRLSDSEIDLIGAAIGDFETQSINTATQFIRSYFLDAYSYSDKCDGVGNNFVAEFFGGDIKRANAAYFATAATCMFRVLGFAARYAEGYYVSVNSSRVAHDGMSVSVTGENTHAWTEVYFDGIGWLPIEVTPTFFAEQIPDSTVDPNDPNGTDSDQSNPSESNPETPPETPVNPATPIDPPKTPEVNQSNKIENTAAFTALVSVSAVVLFILAIMLFFVIRKHCVCLKRRKKLSADGAKFGRAAYEIMVHDCKPFGGFDAAVLEKFGISEIGTKRFIRIVERCVYGERQLTESERKFMLWYIDDVQSKLLSDCGFLRTLYGKYILCAVI